jgi:hypothetical protein
MTNHLDDRLLQLAAEETLGDHERLEVQRHLTDCGLCRAAVESYREIIGQLNAVPVAHAPAAMVDAVMEAYHRSTQPVAALWTDRRLLVAFTAANAVLLLSVVGAIGLHGPLDLLTTWALGLKELLLTGISLVPAVEAIWTAMAHGGIAVVMAIALLLLANVAVLRQTLKLSEEMS